MDDQLLGSLNRQLRAIKIMLATFFVLLLAMLAILGFVTYKVITFTRDVNTKITNFQTKTEQTLDLKSQLCGNTSLSSLFMERDIC